MKRLIVYAIGSKKNVRHYNTQTNSTTARLSCLPAPTTHISYHRKNLTIPQKLGCPKLSEFQNNSGKNPKLFRHQIISP